MVTPYFLFALNDSPELSVTGPPACTEFQGPSHFRNVVHFRTVVPSSAGAFVKGISGYDIL